MKAQNNLGVMCQNDDGVANDINEANGGLTKPQINGIRVRDTT
jgi:hypothetical protein